MQSSTFSVKQKEEEGVLNQSVILNYLLILTPPPPPIFPSPENLTPRETTILTIYQNPISLVSQLT